MGLPARWISPIYGECLTAHAAAAYLRDRRCECRVEGRCLIVGNDQHKLEPVDTPMGRMFPIKQLDATLNALSFETKADYNPD